jgi:hypothetical protein
MLQLLRVAHLLAQGHPLDLAGIKVTVRIGKQPRLPTQHVFCSGAVDQPTLCVLLPVQLPHTWSGNHVIFVQSEINPEGKQLTVLSRRVSVLSLSSAMISPKF